MIFMWGSLRIVPRALPRYRAAAATLNSLRLGTWINATSLLTHHDVYFFPAKTSVPLDMNILRALK